MLKRVLPVILSVIFALSFVAVPSSAFAAKDDYGVDVSAANMSVGSDTSYQSVRLALQALDDAGIILCVSSGNETQDVSMYGTMGGLSRAGDTIIVQDFATD